MKPFMGCVGCIVALVACRAFAETSACGRHATTDGAIAIANLDDQIARLAGSEASVELLLERARFLGDYDALSEAVALVERRRATSQDLLRAAQVHAAEHRFAQAMDELDAAQRIGADAMRTDALRASILVATGQAGAAITVLEVRAAEHPGYASHSALAIAYAELGRYAQADALYALALADLDTTSPFPYAWLHFARGVMWSERAGDLDRGEHFYARALSCLPQFALANIHLAEIDVARDNFATATQRIERVLSHSHEPEALALLGVIQWRTGQVARGDRSIDEARMRFESLLRRHPLAFADHAAAFYLGPGNDHRRAWQLAMQNLSNRSAARPRTAAHQASDMRLAPQR